jgi:hypothetical protein
MLTVESGIAPEVIAERGYRSIPVDSGYATLKALDFPDFQAHPPGLLIPTWTTDGQQLLTVYRPDTPRVLQGKPRKYDQRQGSAVRLDCPPRCRPWLGDASAPVWVTEGSKKADSLASQGAVVLALAGVWGFREKRIAPDIDPPLLADWAPVALAGREVRLVFDSDVTTKAEVQQALDCLTALLTAQGAWAFR